MLLYESGPGFNTQQIRGNGGEKKEEMEGEDIEGEKRNLRLCL